MTSATSALMTGSATASTSRVNTVSIAGVSATAAGASVTSATMRAAAGSTMTAGGGGSGLGVGFGWTTTRGGGGGATVAGRLLHGLLLDHARSGGGGLTAARGRARGGRARALDAAQGGGDQRIKHRLVRRRDEAELLGGRIGRPPLGRSACGVERPLRLLGVGWRFDIGLAGALLLDFAEALAQLPAPGRAVDAGEFDESRVVRGLCAASRDVGILGHIGSIGLRRGSGRVRLLYTIRWVNRFEGGVSRRRLRRRALRTFVEFFRVLFAANRTLHR